jgi:hypothetical protein
MGDTSIIATATPPASSDKIRLMRVAEHLNRELKRRSSG